ncbi:hypothetical protein TNCV_3281381 [Trichonephila clavipes]|nr:hypothetical protein TNCV_3281381 [Trichonephila clavipes]
MCQFGLGKVSLIQGYDPRRSNTAHTAMRGALIMQPVNLYEFQAHCLPKAVESLAKVLARGLRAATRHPRTGGANLYGSM